jgi:hypothetical protein
MNAVLLLIVFTAPAGLIILVEKKSFSGIFENPDPIHKNYKGLKINNEKSRDINFFRIKVSS